MPKKKKISHDDCKYNDECTEPIGICDHCRQKKPILKGWHWVWVGKQNEKNSKR